MKVKGWLAVAFIAVSGALVASCVPEPHDVACRNDAACIDLKAGFHYCLESRCVECIGDESCESGRICTNGACEAKR